MSQKRNDSISVVPGSLTAILERRPAGRFLVIVAVEVEADRSAGLVVAVPQGINPKIKLLCIRAGAAPKPGGARVRRTLRYEEVPAAADYRQVWLGEGDAAISARVSQTM